MHICTHTHLRMLAPATADEPNTEDRKEGDLSINGGEGCSLTRAASFASEGESYLTRLIDSSLWLFYLPLRLGQPALPPKVRATSPRICSQCVQATFV